MNHVNQWQPRWHNWTTTRSWHRLTSVTSLAAAPRTIAILVTILPACSSSNTNGEEPGLGAEGSVNPTTGDAAPAIVDMPSTAAVQTPEGVLPELEPICNGTDDIRFVYAQSGMGGPAVGNSWQFTDIFGSLFFAIDGQCNYWIGENTLHGLRTGNLDETTADEFSEQLHYGRYSSVADFDSQQCPDAGAVILVDSTARLLSRCGGDENDAPTVWREAFSAVWPLMASIDEQSAEAWGPTRLLPVQTSEDANAIHWNLELDLETYAVTQREVLTPQSGVLVDDPDQLASLAELRRAAITQGGSADAAVVTNDQSQAYRLYVRDEVPTKLSEALTAAWDLE